ncbi:MAG: hypothetical protein DI535_16520 [Citrobacter freundii]|nr:MAG: hypothetical protein DI535_16520 [Citrobacter freundii]
MKIILIALAVTAATSAVRGQSCCDSLFSSMGKYVKSPDSIRQKIPTDDIFRSDTVAGDKTNLAKRIKDFYRGSDQQIFTPSEDSSVMWFGKVTNSSIQWLGIATNLPTRFEQQSRIQPSNKWIQSGLNGINSAEKIKNMDIFSEAEDFDKSVGSDIAIYQGSSALSDLNFNLTTTELVPISNGIIALKPSIYTKMMDNLPYIGNQGNIYSCSAWAVAALKSVTDNIQSKRVFPKEKNNTETFYSPSFIFTASKMNTGISACGEGIDLLEAMKILNEKGCVTFQQWPYYRNNINCVLPALTSDILNIAASNKIDIFRHARPDLLEFQYLLSHNVPIAVEVFIDNDFTQKGFKPLWSDSNPFIWSKFGSSTDSRNTKLHSMLCIGYSDNIGSFLMVNSFGPEFGNRGAFWIDYEFFFEILSDAYYIKTPELEAKIKGDKSLIQKLRTFHVSNAQQSTFLLKENTNAKLYLGVKWKIEKIVLNPAQRVVVLKARKPDGVIIRQKIPVGTGLATYFTYDNAQYFIELVNLKAAATNSNYYWFKEPASAEIKVTKLPVNTLP